jgi:predicted CXXCH cytochrome family protein
MRWLIRKVSRRRKGSVSIEDDTHFGDELTIGRGADQAVFLSDLRVALNHATLKRLPNGKFLVESLSPGGVRVNGSLEQSETVSIGAKIEIAQTLLTIVDPPRGVDAAVELSAIEGPTSQEKVLSRAQGASLAGTKLSKRRPAWIAFGATLLFCLLIPASSHFLPGLEAMTQKLHVLGLSSWTSGAMGAPHQFFAEDCRSCHAVAFVSTRNEECIACHKTTTAHADPVKFEMPVLRDQPCADCHKDHNGAQALIRAEQRLCTDCHVDLPTTTAGRSRLSPVTDFGNGHPQFQVTLVAWDSKGQFAPQRVMVNKPGLQEKSGLKFPHDKHLAAGLNSPSGRKQLECASCHALEPGGAKMLPVDFEPMCQECHQLNFDTFAPERQVPHAKIAEIIYMLDGFYAKRALEGGWTDTSAPAVVRSRRRPGVDPALSAAQRTEALSWARMRSSQVAQSLFEGRACVTCHTVSRTVDETTGDVGWAIAPVRVAGVWFPKSEFTHRKHETMACEDCHLATTSKTSEDVLMPPIENCRECHAGEASKTEVATACTSCHGFHLDGQPMMSALGGGATLKSSLENLLPSKPAAAP